MKKLRRALRGEVKLSTAAREVLRRSRAAAQSRRERASLDKPHVLSLARSFSGMNANELLAHFQDRKPNCFFIGFNSTSQKVSQASAVDWRRDPQSGYLWPLDYHRDLKLQRTDGSDIRVVWELNRLGHLLTLDDTTEFIKQLRTWSEQNPYARGPNWLCAMEVALRAINILVAFESHRRSPELDTDSLLFILGLLQQHGRYIENNLEFSHIATSNHYLSDVAGLLWLGVLLPELREADRWREFGRTELLREMDKQVLPEGADYESSTGYHRFVTELFLYSFDLCRGNRIQVPECHWQKLYQMLAYIKAYLRPDGFAPLIGDTDGGQFLPFQHRRADDHAYVLDVAAEILNRPDLKFPEEKSKAFPDSGIYIMRHDDCYLCFNASGAGINGRGSHGHNDALSIEVCAGGRAFIVDPGTYVYTGDLQKRHLFRSTAYHSTVKIDGQEQNTTNPDTPFVIGDEAKPHFLGWKTSDDSDYVAAEHYGYRRLPTPVTHRRIIRFDKWECSWEVEDDFLSEQLAEHDYEAWFHFAEDVELRVLGADVEARSGDVTLVVHSSTLSSAPYLERQHVSHDYGQISESVAACWRVSGKIDKLSWRIYKKT